MTANDAPHANTLHYRQLVRSTAFVCSVSCLSSPLGEVPLTSPPEMDLWLPSLHLVRHSDSTSLLGPKQEASIQRAPFLDEER